jgi:NAD kinase
MTKDFDFEGNKKNIEVVAKRLRERKEAEYDAIKELYNLLLINDYSIAESCLNEIAIKEGSNHPELKKLNQEYKKLRSTFDNLLVSSMSFEALSAAEYLEDYAKRIIYSKDREKLISETEKELKEQIEFNNKKLESDREYYEEFPEHYYNNEDEIEENEDDIYKLIDGSHYLLNLISDLKKEMRKPII